MTTRRSVLTDAALATSVAAVAGAVTVLPAQRVSAAGGAKKGSGPDTPSGYVGQMQVTANILVGNRPRGILQLDAGIYADTPEVRAQVTASGPMIRSAWRGVAQDFANRFYTAGRVPDAQLLATQLQAATDRIVGARRCRVMMVSLIAR